MLLRLLTGSTWAAVGVPNSQSDYQVIAATTVASIALLILAGLPFYSKFHGLLKTLCAPLIGEHNSDTRAHEVLLGNVHEALALLQKSVVDLQRQMDTETSHRKESLGALQRQIEQAVELLGK